MFLVCSHDSTTVKPEISCGEKGAPADSQSESERLDAAANQAIAACGGDMRSTIRALIVANEYLETEVGELMKAVSHAFVRGRFQTYSG